MLEHFHPKRIREAVSRETRIMVELMGETAGPLMEIYRDIPLAPITLAEMLHRDTNSMKRRWGVVGILSGPVATMLITTAATGEPTKGMLVGGLVWLVEGTLLLPVVDAKQSTDASHS